MSNTTKYWIFEIIMFVSYITAGRLMVDHFWWSLLPVFIGGVAHSFMRDYGSRKD